MINYGQIYPVPARVPPVRSVRAGERRARRDAQILAAAERDARKAESNRLRAAAAGAMANLGRGLARLGAALAAAKGFGSLARTLGLFDARAARKAAKRASRKAARRRANAGK